MWEDFMRGNWPAVAAPAPAAPSAPKSAVDASSQTEAVAPRVHHAAPAGVGAQASEVAARRPRRSRRMSVKLAVAGSATLVVGTLLPAVAFAGGTPARGVRSPAGPLVALGDSYASGNLIPDSPVGSPAGCLRSNRNYSADVANKLHLKYVDAACTGATLADMTTPESVYFGTDPPQLNALSADDSVVTLTIGGNDMGYAQVLLTCGLLSLTDPWGAPCRGYYTSGGTDRIAAAIAAEAPRVGALLREISARAPHARVLVVGYPDVLPNTGHGCFPLVPFASGDVAYLRGLEIKLNRMLATAAKANGARYVDTYTATIGHDACAGRGTRDVEGLIPTSPAYPFHPNKRGQQVMSDQVLGALRVKLISVNLPGSVVRPVLMLRSLSRGCCPR